MVEPSDAIIQKNLEEKSFSSTSADDSIYVEPIQHVNSALGNLQINENRQVPKQVNNVSRYLLCILFRNS